MFFLGLIQFSHDGWAREFCLSTRLKLLWMKPSCTAEILLNHNQMNTLPSGKDGREKYGVLV